MYPKITTYLSETLWLPEDCMLIIKQPKWLAINTMIIKLVLITSVQYFCATHLNMYYLLYHFVFLTPNAQKKWYQQTISWPLDILLFCNRITSCQFCSMTLHYAATKGENSVFQIVTSDLTGLLGPMPLCNPPFFSKKFPPSINIIFANINEISRMNVLQNRNKFVVVPQFVLEPHA